MLEKATESVTEIAENSRNHKANRGGEEPVEERQQGMAVSPDDLIVSQSNPVLHSTNNCAHIKIYSIRSGGVVNSSTHIVCLMWNSIQENFTFFPSILILTDKVAIIFHQVVSSLHYCTVSRHHGLYNDTSWTAQHLCLMLFP